jgi:hypothetical protein
LELDRDRLGWLGSGGRAVCLLCVRLADVDAALEESAIFDADAGCSYVAGEGAFTANIDAIGSDDVAADLRPTVTRLPGRLMVPSTLPSMKRDSLPLISPLMTNPLPMVA